MKQSSFARGDTHLPGTTLLTTQTDFAEQMVAGIDRALRDEVAAAPTRRTRKWKRDFSSHEAYEKSSAQSRRRLQRMTGLVDDRLKPDVRAISDAAKTGASAATGGGQGYDIFDICWPVLKGVDGEGLLLEPQGPCSRQCRRSARLRLDAGDAGRARCRSAATSPVRPTARRERLPRRDPCSYRSPRYPFGLSLARADQPASSRVHLSGRFPGRPTHHRLRGPEDTQASSTGLIPGAADAV